MTQPDGRDDLRRAVLGALRHRDFRLFCSGSFVANLGLWMQQIALGWMVYGLTRSASWLGTISLAANAPMFLLGLIGGTIADRASRRTIMLSTLVVLAAGSTTLALLTAMGHITVWWVIAVALVTGTASALYTPAMQSAIPSLVEPGDLLSAISLNSVQFNLARTLGPTIAGLVYGWIGPAGCFSANAAGFMLLAVVMLAVRLPRRPAAPPPPVLRALREGLGYARAHPVIGPALVLAAFMSVFGFPYIILLPAVARDVLGLGASGLGYLMGAVGAGAVIGGLGLSAAGDMRRKEQLAAATAVVFGAALSSFAVVRSVRTMALVLFVMGFLQTTSIASLSTTIQLAVDDGMRGRVMSMMTVILFGFATLGGVVVGFLGDRIGVPVALAAGGVVVSVAAAGALVRAPAVPRTVEA